MPTVAGEGHLDRPRRRDGVIGDQTHAHQGFSGGGPPTPTPGWTVTLMWNGAFWVYYARSM